MTVKNMNGGAKKKKLVVGNWKMNPASAVEAKKIFLSIKKTATGFKKVEIVLCPPSVYVSELAKLSLKSPVSLGVQDSFFVEAIGSYTGFISPLLIKNTGAKYVILGHSERREQGETDETINKKIHAVLKTELAVVFCIGEKERNNDGSYFEYIKMQIEAGLRGIEKNNFSNISVAYEPVFAIGAKTALLPHDIQVMKIFIRKTLIELFGKESAERVRILYGGSVNPENSEAIMQEGEVDGLLVGRDSLVPENFTKILSVINKIK